MTKSIKLTWHSGNESWSKVIGKKLSKDGRHLVQSQWYFTANRQESETLAAARRAEWRKLKKGWAGHQALLEALDGPFPDVPHWYDAKRSQPESSSDTSRAETIEALRRESEPTQSEVAQMYEDMDVAECAALFMFHRKGREGIDFKATTNKSFKIDLDGALRSIHTGIRMVELTREHLEEQRITLLREPIKPTTASNYARAMKMMLDWYFGSVYFYGGFMPKGIHEVFARYPRRREARPKHLSNDVLKAVLSAAGSRRRLYLMLMLNTGMQPTDIPQVAHDAFDRHLSTVRWHRQKNQRVKNPFDQEITSYLWPETMDLVLKFRSGRPGPAFLTFNGRPLYHESANNNRQNAVTKSLAKFFGKLERDAGIDVSAKNFRQTGAQAVHDVTEDYNLSQIWLGRGFKKVDRPYLKEMYKSLNEASSEVRDRLVAAGVFPLPPAKDRNYGG